MNNNIPDNARWGDNFRMPSVDDLLLCDEIAGCWPIALKHPRIPVVREAPAFSMRSGPWTDEEVDLLLRAWPTWRDRTALIQRLNRNPNMVEKKAAQLGLHRPKSQSERVQG